MYVVVVSEYVCVYMSVYQYFQYFSVSSVRACVTDVTSANEPRLREKTMMSS